MRSIKNRILFSLIAVFVLIGTSMQQVEAQPRETVNRILKTDNFLLLIDSSSSMDEAYMGSQKLGLAKSFASRMNQTLPDIKIKSAMRKFGAEKCIFDSTSSLLGLESYAKKPYEDALQTIKEAGGFTPMALGINASSEDLKAAQGKIAVIIVSDWDETGFIYNPIAAAEAMKRQYGDRVCIYPVMVGKDLDGIKLMEKIATVGQCGFATEAEKVSSQQDMVQFVDRVFFTNSVIPDSDNDGVNDRLDKCPGTPAGVSVNSDGCPLDSDKDAVYDYLDKCPGTPEDVRVDKDGCPIQKIIKLNVEFDTGKYDVKDKYREEIKVAADYMQKNPETNVVIEGHTDNVGSEELNDKLSQSRANSVKEYLIAKLGVSKDRLKSVGYGSKKPVASNDTVEGKQKNRRVQAVITTIVKK